MKIREFYELVDIEKNPPITDLPKLKFLVDKYPYFQAASFIYLKCLYIHNSAQFYRELNKIAIFITDKKALFYYILSDEFARFFIKKGKKELSKDRTTILMDAFFESIGGAEEEEKELENAITNSSMAALDYFSFLDSAKELELQEKKTTADEIKFDLTEKSINISVPIPVPEIIYDQSPVEYIIENPDKEEKVVETESHLLKHQDILDSFISVAEEGANMKIVLDINDRVEGDEEEIDESIEEELSDDDIFFTETLANIYIKQRKYERAYEIIKRLSLNYPKKNIYFADQLKFLERLIDNSKNKN